MQSPDGFRPETKVLLESVEKMYAKGVVFEYLALSPNEGGNSTVLEDGTPKVIVNVSHPHQEEFIVHELLHLVLRKEGFPLFRRTTPLPGWVDEKYFGELLTEINEAVLHRVIFHRMQALANRPSLAVLPLLAFTANADYLDDFPEHGAVVSYMRALLERDDPLIQAQYVKRYQQNGWDELLRHGQELADHLRPWGDFTKKQAGKRFIGCLNLLFKGRLVFAGGIGFHETSEAITSIKSCSTGSSRLLRLRNKGISAVDRRMNCLRCSRMRALSW